MYTHRQGDETYVAIVHSESLELVTLDKRKNVLQQDSFALADLKAPDQPTEIQVCTLKSHQTTARP